MKKLFTKQLFRVFTLLTLMLTTAFVANAAYWLRGDYSKETSTGWTVGTQMLDCTDGSGKVYVDLTIDGTFLFKVYNDVTDIWWGYTRNDAYGTATSIPWTFYGLGEIVEGEMQITATNSTVRFTLDPTEHQQIGRAHV